MKKNLVFLALSMIAILGGCAHRRANLEVTENGATYRDTNISIFQKSIDPQEVADAKLTVALAKQIEKGQPAAYGAPEQGKYVGVLINDDIYNDTIVSHPESSAKVRIRSGGAKFIFTQKIPGQIVLYNLSGYTRTYQTYKKGGVYNGLSYDYGIRITQMY